MNALETLNKYFGYTSFKQGQEEIINNVINKKNVVAIMSTGHGKSICYQLPPLITGKMTIVISPLISLMEDQYNSLEKRGIGCICYNSTIKDINRDDIIQNIIDEKYKLVYFSPEMITTETIKNLLKTLNQSNKIGLIAIDEAHCVSLWGNSFRSSYLELSCLKQILKNVPILALTGSATNEVINDISKIIYHDDDVNIIKTSCNRPNLIYFVHEKTNPVDDLRNIIDKNESIIIYCPKRDTTTELCQIIQNMGFKCEAYHAGLKDSIRLEIQRKFMSDEIKCIVATIAFGMGIDKPDVRKVIHYGSPRDMESYVQETGRGGRDGNRSECHLYFSLSDFSTNRYFLKSIDNPLLRTYKEKSITTIEKYIYLTTCRRKYIYEYFSEKPVCLERECCDNCLFKVNSNVDITDSVKIFFPFLRDFSHKYGKTMFINVIRGSLGKTIPQQLTNCKYYSRDRDNSLTYWKIIIQYLQNEGYIIEKILSSSYGSTIGITQKTQSWLSNPYTILMPVKDDKLELLTKKNNKSNYIPSHSNSSSPAHSPSVPASTSASTSTSTSTSTSASASASAYTSTSVSTYTSNKLVKTKTGLSNTEKTTYDLFKEGNLIDDIVKIRKLTKITVEEHFVSMYKSKYLDFNDLKKLNIDYNEEKRDIIFNILKSNDHSKLKPIKELCPSNISYLHIKLAIIDYDDK